MSKKGTLAAWTSALALVGIMGTAIAQLPDTQTQGAVEYVTGGFGQNESEAFKQAQGDWPLMLVFSSGEGPSPAYAGDVRVSIQGKGDTQVFNLESSGPYLLLRLPSGAYEVAATYDGKTQTRRVTVAEGKSQRVGFNWPRPEDD